MEVGIQGRVARHLEQLGEQCAILVRAHRLGQIENQHAVVAHPGELVTGIARHQAGAHLADLAAASTHFELGTPGQRQHQLVVVVGMFVGLIIQAQQAGVVHGADTQADSAPTVTTGARPWVITATNG